MPFVARISRKTEVLSTLTFNNIYIYVANALFHVHECVGNYTLPLRVPVGPSDWPPKCWRGSVRVVSGPSWEYRGLE